MTAHWIAVASLEHVRRGLREGFMQVCHGKAAPLKRIKPHDYVMYYSPTRDFRGQDRLQAFTALGIVRERDPYKADMGGGFCPYRRDVAWMDAQDAPIRPLLDILELTRGQVSWGYRFRFGLLAISEHDFRIIAEAMKVREFIV